MNGFINLYKPSGMSSAYALSLIKKKFKGEKMGHMGTLDPLASGVLPIAFGKSTRLFDFLLEKNKIYKALFTFGYETDTLDRGGKIVKENGVIPTLKEIESVLPNLIGSIEQLPPIYSAKNVNGKRSYELARKGIEVELKPKTVFIKDIKLTRQVSCDTYEFVIECKGGTYIRSICRDMAFALNTYATMTALERLESGIFTKENSFTLEEIINNFDKDKMLILPDTVVNLETVNLSKKKFSDVINGRLCLLDLADGFYKVYGENQFIGIGKIVDNNLKIKAFIR